MARQTNTRLREKVIYSVFVRNHTKEGTFQALEGDLDRLAALGTDIIWLMPIHPIGEVGRKGTLGSPYAIRDFRGINPEYGTLGDFMHLVGEIHKRGMKCIIDVVYNHTYRTENPLNSTVPYYFFRQDPDGSFSIRSSSSGTRRGIPPVRWRTGPMWWIWITATVSCGSTRSRL